MCQGRACPRRVSVRKERIDTRTGTHGLERLGTSNGAYSKDSWDGPQRPSTKGRQPTVVIRRMHPTCALTKGLRSNSRLS